MRTLEEYRSDLETAKGYTRAIELRKTELEEEIERLEQSLVRAIAQEEALEDFIKARAEYLDHQLPLPGIPEPINGRRKRNGKTPDVHIMQELLSEHGPLHITRIVEMGKEMGVSFEGKKDETNMARDKLYASKRFVNFGSNVWGLPGQHNSNERMPT